MHDSDVESVMRRQHGLVSQGQARAAGMSSWRIRSRLERGAWVEVERHVYAPAASPQTWRSRLLAACLATGGVASHRSAAVLHGVADYWPGIVEVTVPVGSWQPISGTLHQSTQWYADQHCEIDGIPCTNLLRTLIDVAAIVGADRLDATIDAVLRVRGIEFADLVELLIRHARKGRDGCGRLRAALARRQPDGGVPLSRWSRMVGQLLEDAGLAAPSYEYRVLDPTGALIAQVDLAYPGLGIAIELDSVTWHLNRESFQTDRARWNALTLAGWQLLVFTWRDFTERVGVVHAVRAAVEAKSVA